MNSIIHKFPFIFTRTLALLLLLTLGLSGGVGAAAENTSDQPELPVSLVAAVNSSLGIDLNQAQQPIPLPRTGRDFSEETMLFASDAAVGDKFGYAVDFSGNTAVIGAPEDQVGSNFEQGSAYIFVRNGDTWTQQVKLVADDGAGSDYFGRAVSIDENTVVVGADSADVGDGLDQGAAYVFVRNGTTWTQQGKLFAEDGESEDFFGTSVVMDGHTAIIGASADDVGANTDQGSAYVFVYADNVWGLEQKITANDGAEKDYFGTSVGLVANNAIIGAIRDDVGVNTDQGSAYIFNRSGETWTQKTKLTADNGAAEDYFGTAVDLNGFTALVGASGDDDPSNENHGSVYVFVRNGDTWSQQIRLTASDAADGDVFGSAVALDGDLAVIGAPLDDNGEKANQGSAYVFSRNGTFWTQEKKLTASDGIQQDYLGSGVGISANIVIAGAYDHDNEFATDGVAYVFIDPELAPTNTPTASVTPEETSTPAVTPTATNTQTAGLELLSNGGFETTTRDTVLDPWVLKNGVKDKIKCNKPGKEVAHTGLCAFVFKGSIGENSVLQQSPDASAITPALGDTFDFGVYVQAGNAAAGKIKVVVKYSDATLPGKLSISLTPTAGYQPFTDSLELRDVAITKVKVQFKHQSSSGKVLIDDASLSYLAGS